ncbi:MAG: MarR family EPS-associated transcriptional regulator [Candidatus Omnitrophica bacterium]|nr:MarR family EPS-associated transcriptional regulator [Candidatus Omnitrophota bacterium]
MKDNIREDIREDIFNILRILYSGSKPTQRDLSSCLGVSLGKINYLLKVIAKRGLVSIKHFTQEGQKARKIGYLLTQKGIETKLRYTHHYLKRKEEEYLALKKEAEASFGTLPKGFNVKRKHTAGETYVK